jgi:SAM-dependent methyltransferase
MDPYERSAFAYDVIQRARGRDYPGQARSLVAEVAARGVEPASLLDVACGTGLHLAEFRRYIPEVVGVDVSRAMVARARTLLPDVDLLVGDMRALSLGRAFDVITCLFSSIGYLLSIEDMRAAISTMARHLSPGGLLFVEPWLRPDQWRVGHRTAEAGNENDAAVGRVSVTDRDGHISLFTLYWTVATDGGVEQWTEPHRMALYTIDEYSNAFSAAGLDVEFEPNGLVGRGMFVGTQKP